MRVTAVLFFLTLAAKSALANVNQIDITKISSDGKLVSAFDFIKTNQEYYDHWTPQWTYDKPKEELINQLRGFYKNFIALSKKESEVYLLLGDIAHYLYNMDDRDYFDLAVDNYEAAAKSNPNEYRAYWFLGYHYVASNLPGKGIANLLKAEQLLPAKHPAAFWEEYAFSTSVANMPSHSIYAMERFKSITGEESSFQQQLGKTVYNRIVPVDKNNTYKKEEIWAGQMQTKMFELTSRPLGIKMLMDSTWGLSIYDYQKNQAITIIKPHRITSKKGKEIGYTIAIFMKTVNDKDKLEDYLSGLMSTKNKKQITFSNKYDKAIAYETMNKEMYADIGGAHMYLIGIEREAPKYPGLLLENPMEIPDGTPGELQFYTVGESKNRFKGKIFYAFMLDSCEDIHEESRAIFKSLFEDGVVIE